MMLLRSISKHVKGQNINSVIAREERPQQSHNAAVINKRTPSLGKDTMWQTVRNYGIFRRLPRRGAPRNDGGFGLRCAYIIKHSTKSKRELICY